MKTVKTRRLVFTVLLLFSAAVFQVHAQQNEWEREPQALAGAPAQSGGVSMAKDESSAIKLYGKAAEQNGAEAQYNLGFSYQHGLDVLVYL